MANNKPPRSIWRNQRAVLCLLAIVSLIFLAVTYQSSYVYHNSGVSTLNKFLISCTIALPEIIIWVIATLAALRFKYYSNQIRTSPDGRAMSLIATAMMYMVAYIILLTVFGSFVTVSKNTSHLKLAVNLGNYIPLVVALLASGYFLAGAVRLNDLVPLRMKQRSRLLIVGAFALISTLYVWDFDNRVPHLQGHDGVPQFAASATLLTFTYAIPYVIVWAMGVFACISIANYARYTKGTIYRELLGNLYRGVLLVFICTFLAQLFIESDVSLEHFSFLLFLIYCLLLAGVAGFLLIYQASTRLQALENI
jgi:hypothetical protein